MERVKLDIWVGIFVALGIIAMFYMATRVGNLTSNDVKETYEVKAYFENIGGLKPRAAVKASGVVVGRIGSIVFDPEAFHAVVKINIDERYSFPTDTFANIYTAGLLGEQYLSFTLIFYFSVSFFSLFLIFSCIILSGTILFISV